MKRKYKIIIVVSIGLLVALGITACFSENYGFTTQTVHYDCSICGMSMVEKDSHFFYLGYSTEHVETAETVHFELFVKAGLSCSEHIWRFSFINSWGWLGYYDGPLGEYGFCDLDETETSAIMKDVEKYPDSQEKAKALWRIRLQRNLCEIPEEFNEGI